MKQLKAAYSKIITVWAISILGTAGLLASENGKVTESIQQLNHDDFQMRDSALLALWKLGDEAIPELERSSLSNDPEVSARSKELLHYLRSGLLHDSPQNIKEIVIEYSHSQPQKKLALIQHLQNLGYSEQALNLAHNEKDDTAVKLISPTVLNIARRLAYRPLVNGELKKAKDILYNTPDTLPFFTLRAWFHRYSNIEEYRNELKKSALITGEKNTLWRIALHRVDGNIEAALTEAYKLPATEAAGIISTLSLFQGDIKPWIETNSETITNKLSDTSILGLRIQKNLINNRIGEADHLAKEIIQLVSDNPANNHIKTQAVITLAANGYRDEALKIYKANFPTQAFSYYQSQELPLESLETFGIAADTPPPFLEWVSKTTENIEQNKEDVEKIILIADYLKHYGHSEHLMAVLSPIMKLSVENKSLDWENLIRIMANQGLGEIAIEFLIRQKDNEELLTKGVYTFLARNERSDNHIYKDHIWESLVKRNPDNLELALRQLGYLTGHLPDLENKTQLLHDHLSQEAESMNDGDSKLRMRSLYEFANIRNDLKLASSMLESLTGDDRTLEYIRHIQLQYYKTFQQWDKANEIIEQNIRKQPNNLTYIAYDYIRNLRNKSTAKASEAYQKMMLLSLGNPQILIHLTNTVIHPAGYYEKAHDIYELVAINAPHNSPVFHTALESIINHINDFYETKQWSKVHALSEVFLEYVMKQNMHIGLFSFCLNMKFNSTFAKAIQHYEQGETETSIQLLSYAKSLIPGSGVLADHFYPIVRELDIEDQYNEWFEESYQHVLNSCKLYPDSHNAHNTAAWLASRSVRRLDEALNHARTALQIKPNKPAYLDTMGEVWFAKGNRTKSLEWSNKALEASRSHAQGTPTKVDVVIANYNMLHRQKMHFKNDPLPKQGN